MGDSMDKSIDKELQPLVTKAEDGKHMAEDSSNTKEDQNDQSPSASAVCNASNTSDTEPSTQTPSLSGDSDFVVEIVPAGKPGPPKYLPDQENTDNSSNGKDSGVDSDSPPDKPKDIVEQQWLEGLTQYLSIDRYWRCKITFLSILIFMMAIAIVILAFLLQASYAEAPRILGQLERQKNMTKCLQQEVS